MVEANANTSLLGSSFSILFIIFKAKKCKQMFSKSRKRVYNFCFVLRWLAIFNFIIFNIVNIFYINFKLIMFVEILRGTTCHALPNPTVLLSNNKHKHLPCLFLMTFKNVENIISIRE